MKLGEFHTEVSSELKRGTSLDNVIPRKVRDAVQFLERNHAMKYMERWISIDLDPGDRLIDLPFFVRNFKFLRLLPTEGRYGSKVYLKPMDPEDEEPAGSQCGPLLTGYSQIGQQSLRFNADITEKVRLESVAFCFTDWQTTVPTFRHYLLDVASDLLMAMTMMGMAVYMKDQRMYAVYRTQRDEALRTFYVLDTDVSEGDKYGQMEYTGF